MSPTHKQCPQCLEVTELWAPRCAKCGHQFRTSFPPPDQTPPDQTQLVTPPPAPNSWAAQWNASWPGSTPAQQIGLTVAIVMAIFFYIFFVQRPNYGTRDSWDDLAKVKLGMKMDEVRTIMGTPTQNQDMQSVGVRSQYLYFDVEGTQVQICFTNGYVESINRY